MQRYNTALCGHTSCTVMHIVQYVQCINTETGTKYARQRTHIRTSNMQHTTHNTQHVTSDVCNALSYSQQRESSHSSVLSSFIHPSCVGSVVGFSCAPGKQTTNLLRVAAHDMTVAHSLLCLSPIRWRTCVRRHRAACLTNHTQTSSRKGLGTL